MSVGEADQSKMFLMAYSPLSPSIKKSSIHCFCKINLLQMTYAPAVSRLQLLLAFRVVAFFLFRPETALSLSLSLFPSLTLSENVFQSLADI